MGAAGDGEEDRPDDRDARRAFIEKIDQLLETGLLGHGEKYKQVVVRVIELSRSSLPHAHAASKLNRDPLFIQNLMAHGEQQAEEFLAALAFERAWAAQDVDAVLRLFAEDPELVSAPRSAGRAGTGVPSRYVSSCGNSCRPGSGWT